MPRLFFQLAIDGYWCCLLNWSHFVVVWLQIFLNCKETLEASLQGSHCGWISPHPWPWSVGHGVSGGQGAHRRIHTLCVRWWESVSNETLLTLWGFVSAELIPTFPKFERISATDCIIPVLSTSDLDQVTLMRNVEKRRPFQLSFAAGIELNFK